MLTAWLGKRARSFGRATGDVVQAIWRDLKLVRSRAALQAEVERLEERRLLSADFKTVGGFWVVYYHYSFKINSGTCCEASTQTVDVNGAIMPDGSGVPQDHGAASIGGNIVSSWPVRYADGQPIVSSNDLSSDGFGQVWGQTRTYSDLAAATGAGGRNVNGNSWTVAQMPQIIAGDVSNSLAVIEDGNNTFWFDKDGTNADLYHERRNSFDTLRLDSGLGEYILADENGGLSYFFALDSSDPTEPAGQLDKHVDASGNVTQLNYAGSGDSDAVPEGYLKSVTRSNDSASETWKYSYLPAYGTGGNYLLKRVMLIRDSAIVRQVDYDYYDGSTSLGSENDLSHVTIEDGGGPGTITSSLISGTSSLSPGTPYYYVVTAVLPGGETTASDEVTETPGSSQKIQLSWTQVAGATAYKVYRSSSSSLGGEEYLATVSGGSTTSFTDDGTASGNTNIPPENLIDQTAYIYYKSGDAHGYTGGLKYVFSGPSIARAVAAGVDPTSPSSSDADLQRYSDNYFEYGKTSNSPNEREVTNEIAHSGGCSCAGEGGQGVYLYNYTLNPAGPSGTLNYNYWQMQTVETMPDGSRDTVYTNSFGQPMLDDIFDGTHHFYSYYRYDDQGHTIWQADNSAITGYDPTKSDLVNFVSGNAQFINDSTGSIRVNSYYNVGWDFAGDAGISSNDTAFTTASAPEGTQAAFLNSGGSVSQDVSDWASGTYTLSLKAAESTGSFQTLQVTIDPDSGSPTTLTFGGSSSISLGTSYSTYTSASFSLSAGLHTIKVTDGGSGTALVDDLGLSRSGGGAPTIEDAGFESPSLADGTYRYNPPGSTATSSTAGGYSGYLENTSIQLGELGTPVLLSRTAYFTHGDDNGTVIVPTATDTIYGSVDNATGNVFDSRTTSYQYTWYAGTNEMQAQSVLLPQTSAYQSYTGTASGTGSTTTLVDTSRTEASGFFVGYTLKITGGTDSGQSATVTAYNASTHTFTFSPAFSSATTSSSAYQLVAPIRNGPYFSGTATGTGSTTTLVDTTRSEASGSFIGDILLITGGTDAGESAVVTNYDSSTHTLTLYPALSSATTSTSVYYLTPPSDESQVFYDRYGRVIWSRDADGYVDHVEYDDGTGAVVKSEIDSSTPYPGHMLTDGPLAYLRLDESAGTTATDSSGNGNTGTFTGGYTLSQTSSLTRHR